MKLSTILFVAAASLISTIASGQIANSRHNFSANQWSGNQICRPCHIPHGGNIQAGALWNHTMSSASYVMFEGETMANEVALDRVSRLCMSCHDGTVALDSFGGANNGSTFINGNPYNGDANLGTDLRNDHPIGADAVYSTSTTSTSWVPQTITNVGLPNESHKVINGVNSLSLYKMQVAGVDKWVVGCKTCHDPHNRGNFAPMLRFSNAGSQMCLTCHIK
jgi:predicted CXXCH cytochrome family protein